MTDALLLAAGLGTRLRPLTEVLPKPAVPVANRPLLAYSLEHLGRAGARRVALNAHHLAEAIPPLVERWAPAGVATTVVREATLLGTGGGVRNLWLQLRGGAGDEPLFVMNGDVIFAPHLADALELHRKLDAVATMVLRPDPSAAKYGAVEIDATNRVRRLLGQPADVTTPLRTLMFTGVHVLSPRAFDALPEQGCIVKNSYRRWIDSGEVVAGFVDETPWRDLGTLPQYLAANIDLARGALTWPDLTPGPNAVLYGAGARIGDGAKLRDVVIGGDAEIAPDADLERVVIWPRTRASGVHLNSVITPGGVVRVE